MGILNKLHRSIYNFFQYLRKGGVTYITLSQIQYDKILEGKRVIITGGSSGIGFAIAKKFISVGAKVLITGRNIYKLEMAKADINSSDLYIMQWDMEDVGISDMNLNKAIDVLGGLDMLINNAGFLQNRDYVDVDSEFFDKMMNTNVKSIYFLSRSVCQYFVSKKQNGKILNITSMNGFQGGLNPYFLSKSALNSFTVGLAKKYIKNGIIVNAIAPGMCNSSINYCNASEENAYSTYHLNKRMILPEEIAELALFMCSNAGDGIVGQVIRYDGGHTLV